MIACGRDRRTANVSGPSKPLNAWALPSLWRRSHHPQALSIRARSVVVSSRRMQQGGHPTGERCAQTEVGISGEMQRPFPRSPPFQV
jgi:hypothetical protein